MCISTQRPYPGRSRAINPSSLDILKALNASAASAGSASYLSNASNAQQHHQQQQQQQNGMQYSASAVNAPTMAANGVPVKMDHGQPQPATAGPKAAPDSSSHAKKHAHIVVQHNYHDHANDPSNMYSEEHPVRGGVTTPFPLKLHEMLQKVEQEGLEHVISWQPHGRCFVVHKPQEFVQVLPNYFKLSKLASFQRQLNLYGFQRITKGYDKGGYYHELFLRGKDFMAHAIQRVKVKGTGVRARSNPAQEPDFWNMPWVNADTAVSRIRDESVSIPEASVESNNNNNSNSQGFQLPTVSPPASANIYSPPAQQAPCANNAYLSAGNIAAVADLSFMPPPPSMMRSVPAAAQAQAQPAHVSSPSASSAEEDDIVCTFGNRTFHALDVSNSNNLWQPIDTSSAYDTSVDAYAEFQRSNGLVDEMEDFFQDFDFGRDVSSSIPNLDDDGVFGDVLEQIIA